MDELKPCPFCGSADVGTALQMPQFGEVVKTYVVCNACGCRTAEYKKASVAVTIWNERATK